MDILTFKHGNGTIFLPIKHIVLIKLQDDGRICIQTKNNYFFTEEKYPSIDEWKMRAIVKYIFDYDNTQIIDFNKLISKFGDEND